MSQSLIIFIVSLIAIILFVWFRVYEYKTGRMIVSQKMRLRIERTVSSFYRKIRDEAIKLGRELKNFLKDLPKIFAHVMHFYWEKFSKRVDDFFHNVKHKK